MHSTKARKPLPPLLKHQPCILNQCIQQSIKETIMVTADYSGGAPAPRLLPASLIRHAPAPASSSLQQSGTEAGVGVEWRAVKRTIR
jgi:hypothetical protein